MSVLAISKFFNVTYFSFFFPYMSYFVFLTFCLHLLLDFAVFLS